MSRHLLCLILLFTFISNGAAQTAPQTTEQPTDESQAAALAANTLLLDLRALEAESKELIKPLDAARAKAEVAAAAWALDGEWAKSLLREALELTFPAEVDRAKLRDRPAGSKLQPPTPEDSARSRVRSRVLKVASRDRAFAQELAAVASRELGRQEEVMHYAQLASAAAGEGRIEEAGGHVLHMMEAEPTMMNVGFSITEVAAHDRAAADRLILRYVDHLRTLPVSVFAERGQAALRVPLSFASMMHPQGSFMFGRELGPVAPAGREAVRAYVRFVLDTLARMEQSQPGGSSSARFMLLSVWPFLAEHAPELAAQFHALERASREPGAKPAELVSFGEMDERYDRRYAEQIKTAKESKDQSYLEQMVMRAKGRKDFANARKLLDLMNDGEQKRRLAEVVDADEAVHLTGTGDTAGAERCARRLFTPNLILMAYPPLIKRLAKNKDAATATMLTAEAVKKLRQSAETNSGNDVFIPSALASVAASIAVFKQSRALLALSELALAVRPLSEQTALDILDEIVQAASKGRITSEHGEPNFNADAFAQLAELDEGRVRQTAARLEDRLQRIVALAAVYRRGADSLAEQLKAARESKEK